MADELNVDSLIHRLLEGIYSFSYISNTYSDSTTHKLQPQFSGSLLSKLILRNYHLVCRFRNVKLLNKSIILNSYLILLWILDSQLEEQQITTFIVEIHHLPNAREHHKNRNSNGMTEIIAWSTFNRPIITLQSHYVYFT